MAPTFLTSALIGGEWLNSGRGHFTSWERIPGSRILTCNEVSCNTNATQLAESVRIEFPFKYYKVMIVAELLHDQSAGPWVYNRVNCTEAAKMRFLGTAAGHKVPHNTSNKLVWQLNIFGCCISNGLVSQLGKNWSKPDFLSFPTWAYTKEPG
jgi:hypothetical protein